MSDTAENCFNALVALSSNPEHESLRDALVEEISYENLQVVVKRLLSLNLGHTTSAVPVAELPPSPSKSAAQSSTSVPRVLRDALGRHSSGIKSVFHKLRLGLRVDRKKNKQFLP
jgi:hypothetical protein